METERQSTLTENYFKVKEEYILTKVGFYILYYSVSKMLDNLKISRGQIKSKLTRFNSFLNSIDKNNLNDAIIAQLKLRIINIEGCIEEFDRIQSELEKIDTEELNSTERESFENIYFKLMSDAKQLCFF